MDSVVVSKSALAGNGTQSGKKTSRVMNRLFSARRPSRWHWLGLIGLVGLLVWTIARAGQGCSAISVWDLQNLDRVAAWAGELAGRVGLRLGVYLAAGLILPPVLRAFLAWGCPPDPSPDERLGERGAARRGFWRWIALVVTQVVLALAWVAGLAGLALGMIGLAALRTSWCWPWIWRSPGWASGWVYGSAMAGATVGPVACGWSCKDLSLSGRSCWS